MCGIFGIVASRPITGSELAAMSRALRHRGPDDEGFLFAGEKGAFCLGGADTPRHVLESGLPYAPARRLDGASPPREGGVVLGHRRLSILDLSAHGHQPMSYRDRYWMVFNGEVYNYVELRQELSDLGHRFGSTSDTEVVLAAYAQWGPECLTRFNGMWGLAILDLERGSLFLARDRYGVKPLYLWSHGGALAFASEIKAFSALEGWRARANMPRLLDFLVWSVSDHGAETMFDGVLQLPAGHFVLMDVTRVLAGHAADEVEPVRSQRWYTAGSLATTLTGDGADELRRVLADAVRLRLRADVPVGSCLSGGLDSSSVVCLMSDLLRDAGVRGNLKTFTARSDDGAFDESDYARSVVERAGSDAVFVTPRPEKLFDDLRRLTWHQDEPYASSSIFAQWCVFEAAREKGVVVMLDGQGADEALGGYRGFFGAYLAGLFRQGRLVSWGREVSALRREIGFSWVRSMGYTAAYCAPGALHLIGRFDARAFSDRGWLCARHSHAFRTDPIRLAGGRVGSVREMSLAQITATNLPMLLHWEDRDSMAFSIEARTPFLDYRVVELSLALADSDKVGRGVSKAALRRAMRGVVPQAVLDRKDKMGFLTAEPLWITREWSPRFRGMLSSAVEALPGVVDPSILARFDEVVGGKRRFDHRYWRAMAAGSWASAFSVQV
jgi:asparagine synthase (glutamine-hydrolysing)